MTSIRKIKKRMKAIRPRTFTLSFWVKISGEDWKVITKTISSLNPKKVILSIPDGGTSISGVTLERGDTTAKWNALHQP